jgi:hypothetical protein
MFMRPKGLSGPLTLAILFQASGVLGEPAAAAPPGAAPPPSAADAPPAVDATGVETEEVEVDEAVEEARADEPAADATAPTESDTAADGASGKAVNPYDMSEPETESPEALKRKPAPGKSVLYGHVIDESSGEPIAEVEFSIAGQGVVGRTDAGGQYRLELNPGTYRVEVRSDLYDKVTLEQVVLRANKVLETKVSLKPQEGAIEEVVLEEAGSTDSVAGLALTRQKSVSAGDAIGREQISKGTDSNAAQAAQRVVGANIVGGRFVYVRGLGERYSNSLLGGYPLPSPEPDRAAVPLDVFPAAVLDSITIQKTFTPDMPGDFAGGSVQIETRAVPRSPLFNVNVWGGVNTQATFNDRLSYGGGGLDWLGFDDGTRTFSEAQGDDVEQITRDINSPFSLQRSSTPVDHGLTVVGGNTFKLGGSQELGFLASANYSHRYFVVPDEIINEYSPDPDQEAGYRRRLSYTVERAVDQVRWGGFGKVTYTPTSTSNITLSGLHSQLADNSAVHYQGVVDSQINAVQSDWVQRGLSFGVLSGRHQIPKWKGAEINWDASLARAARAQPDRRDNAYSLVEFPPPGAWVVRGENDASRHFWSEQTEDSRGGKLDYKQPLFSGKLPLTMKVGGLVNVKERRFDARRLFFATNTNVAWRRKYGKCPPGDFTLNCPDGVFSEESIDAGLRAQDGWIDHKGDKYTSHLRVYSGYAMFDTNIADQLRIAAGGRVEVTDQGITPLMIDNSVDDQVQSAQLNSTDFLPAVSMVLGSHSKLKTRASYGRTLARPQVRELAPFEFADYFSGRSTVGNPNLTFSSIDNVDFRVEYFPSLAEVLAMSAFYKHITHPIEPYLIPADANPVVTYGNAEEANLIGAEFEVRKGLSFLTTVLRDFSVNANLALTYSRTEVEQTGLNTITHPSRALVNQSPWVLNLALDYENKVGTTARVAYNVAGPALVLIGQLGLDDGYLQPFHRLDLSVGQKFLKHYKATLSVQNLVNDDNLTTMGKEIRDDNILNQFSQGTQIQLGLGYEL